MEECWKIVETSEKTRKHCMMTENCCYDFSELLTLNLARNGFFGEIVHAEVQYRPRKALICRLQDPSGQLSLRFLHFYPSQIAALKVGTKLRVFGEVRGGFFGWEMVHPQYRPVRCLLYTSPSPRD